MTVTICLAVALAVAIMTCGILYERWGDAARDRDLYRHWSEMDAARADRAEAELASERARRARHNGHEVI